MNAPPALALALSLVFVACAVDSPPPAVVEAPPVATDPVIAGLQAQPLVSTRHGACRMECRHIDVAEVRHVLATGAIDPERTRHDGACPSYAIEGTTPDGVHARVVLAGCVDETRVVTVIDLDTDHPCSCE